MPSTIIITDSSSLIEAERIMNICNACRYCEGYCAVFPAMAKRRAFDATSLDYLANLCHNCTACYHACQYKPPHEFGVNVPNTFAELRLESYQRHIWPVEFAGLLRHNGLVVALVTALVLILVMLLMTLLTSPDTMSQRHLGPGAFYAVISHKVMIAVGGGSFVLGLVVLTVGALQFWQSSGMTIQALLKLPNWLDATRWVATMQYLGGGHGEGCNTDSEVFSNARRYFHQFTMWGFLLCFAATCSATFYEYVLGRLSPFPFMSLPVILGIVGGTGLIIGPAGLWWIKRRSDPVPSQYSGLGMDYAFLALLELISLTGMALLVLRETTAMPWLLTVHLGFVFAFFLLLPYSKFVHGVYRFFALLKYAEEHRATTQKTTTA
jgi:citrate/tricarballylate utilization protein